MGNRINIGLIGLGYWGSNYLRVLTQLNNVNLYYVCDVDDSKFKKYSNLPSNVKFSNNPVELATDKEVKAVIIATPASTHYNIAKVMLETGKHVLVEKPLTMNYKQALELENLSNEVNKILMVGHIYCFNPAVNYIRNILKSGGLGNLYYGIGLRLGLGPIRRDASCTWDLATHDMAMLDFLLNKIPVSVSAQASSFLQREIKIYDYVTIQLNYDNFQFSLIESWYTAEKIRSWYIVGSKSMLKFDDMNKDASITIYHKYATVTTNEYKAPDIVVREGDIIIPRVSQEEPLLLEVRHFLDSIKYNRRPIADGTQGARVVKILEAVEDSIKKGGMPVSVRD